ncbi:MAG: MFS family permease [Cyclobacteriaceae bacterium]|jgi:MFS family permease
MTSEKLLEGNLRRFVLFRLLYSARFYYPVFTVLFLDYGLSLEQFGLLNLVWALTIVVAEVPSGALADIVGRKRLLVFAVVLMVIEMTLLVLVPIGASPVLFVVFLVNRVFSGLSEAAASGADEALAYDSLKALGREDEWAHLLEKSTRVVSAGFFVAMITGAFAYDADVVNGLLAWFGPNISLAPEMVIRLPIVLTLCTSIILLLMTFGLHDIDRVDIAQRRAAALASGAGVSAIAESFRQIIKAGRWTLGHQFVLFVIIAALSVDSVARSFVILASEYYRLIDIPVSWFGFIGAGMSLIGIVLARLSRLMVTHLSPVVNFMWLSVVLLVALLGLMQMVPYYGVVFAIGAFAVMGMVQFQTSYYINRAVDSKIRATVLSFKGLALNLGLGVASLLYTALVSVLRAGSDPAVVGDALIQQVFVSSLQAFPLYFIGLVIATFALARWLFASRAVFFVRPGDAN